MKVTTVSLLCLVVLVIGLVFLLTGCNISKSSNTGDERFVEVKGASGAIMNNNYRIVYDRTTKVMYYMSDSLYNHGSLCPIYNADGSLMIYIDDDVESDDGEIE